MATINLGAIKFNWKGAYNSGTSYAVDDVVSSGGNSYVCIQAHTTAQAVGDATAYWNIMSAKGTNGTNGTNGTDLTSTLTTRGDIVFKGASALTRLPKGSTGQVLKQGANDPEWGTDAGGKIGQVLQTVLQAEQSVSPGANTWGAFTNAFIAITPTATSSKIWVGFNGIYGADNWSSLRITRAVGGGSYSHLSASSGNGESNRQPSAPFHGYRYNDHNQARNFNFWYLDSPNTTSAVQYRLEALCHDSNNQFLGRSYQNDNYTSITKASTFINAWEILA